MKKKHWWILVLFFRCISGSIFNIQKASEKLESFESISTRAKESFEKGTKRVEKVVTEKTGLLLDYIGKFINQVPANPKPAMKSRGNFSEEGLDECEHQPIDAEECIPFINYVGKKKHKQLSGLAKAIEKIKTYFTAAKKKCEPVLRKERCKYLVTELYNKRVKIFEHRMRMLVDDFETYDIYDNYLMEKCFT